MQDPIAWIIAGAIAVMILFFGTLFAVAHRKRVRIVEHLRTKGIDSRATVIDARRSNFRVNNRRGWSVILRWRHPATGKEHQLESDLIWRDNYLFDEVRSSLRNVGELPVRVDPTAPEEFHTVDVSSLRE